MTTSSKIKLGRSTSMVLSILVESLIATDQYPAFFRTASINLTSAGESSQIKIFVKGTPFLTVFTRSYALSRGEKWHQLTIDLPLLPLVKPP